MIRKYDKVFCNDLFGIEIVILCVVCLDGEGVGIIVLYGYKSFWGIISYGFWVVYFLKNIDFDYISLN